MDSIFVKWGILLSLATPIALGAPCLTGSPPCRELLPLAGKTLPLYRSFPLAGLHPRIERAVVVVHGTARNADEYFADVAEAARQAGAEESTLVVAPQFQTVDDKPGAAELYWTSSGWKQGDESLNLGSALSSYSALDGILDRLADRSHFPGLRTVVVTGHSAGGQLLSRFLATTTANERFPTLSLLYVVSNPSTYLYPTALRPLAGSTVQFALPAGGCPDFDEYPYGLKKRNHYTGAVGERDIVQHLKNRNITLLLGEDDTGLEYLDTSCGANLQGPNRFLRGSAYAEYLDKYLQPAGLALVTVPGVGHSGKGMYQSPEGRAVLFSLTQPY